MAPPAESLGTGDAGVGGCAAAASHRRALTRIPMNETIVVLLAAVLFLCVSMYLGTGWSLLLFTFPIAPQLTVQNYYMQFVPQVEAATKFFTYMTMLMLLVGGVLIWAEWGTAFIWQPIIVLLGIVAATLLTTSRILPLNKLMKDGIKDPAQLRDILARWMGLNRIRVGLWTVQWAAMMWYFVAKVLAP
jgi:hypothetical protein